MNYEELTTQDLKLPNGAIVKVEIRNRSQEGPVSSGKRIAAEFSELSNSIRGIAQGIEECLEGLKPTKTAVTFGLELSVESGALSAMIVKGAGKANLELTLEWERKAD